jgi:hypothetical protein
MRIMDSFEKLRRVNRILGPTYGTEHFSIFLYSLVRIQRPRTMVELGTGLGVSAFWMGHAATENRVGHVYTVDDFQSFDMAALRSQFNRANLGNIDGSSPKAYFYSVARILGIQKRVTFINRTINLEDRNHFSGYPFSRRPIDLVFSDFVHGPEHILQILGQFLPRMAASASIFIDSAPTYWPSFLLFEHLVTQLNSGKVPLGLQNQCYMDLGPIVRSRRFTLVSLTESADRAQNATSWLKIEPLDIFPHPKANMRL